MKATGGEDPATGNVTAVIPSAWWVLVLLVVSRPNRTMQTNFNYHGGTEPRLQIQQVGTEPRITYHVDRENTPYPRPEAFDGVGTAMVKLACMDLEGELDELRQDALDAVTELNAAMVDLHVEGREDHDWYDLYMGTLSILDGVEKEVEQVRVGEADE